MDAYVLCVAPLEGLSHRKFVKEWFTGPLRISLFALLSLTRCFQKPARVRKHPWRLRQAKLRLGERLAELEAALAAAQRIADAADADHEESLSQRWVCPSVEALVSGPAGAYLAKLLATLTRNRSRHIGWNQSILVKYRPRNRTLLAVNLPPAVRIAHPTTS